MSDRYLLKGLEKKAAKKTAAPMTFEGEIHPIWSTACDDQGQMTIVRPMDPFQELKERVMEHKTEESCIESELTEQASEVLELQQLLEEPTDDVCDVMGGCLTMPMAKKTAGSVKDDKDGRDRDDARAYAADPDVPDLVDLSTIAAQIAIGSLPQGYELTAEDVGTVLDEDFGEVFDGDVGKKVYLTDYGISMENVEQRDIRRLREKGKMPSARRRKQASTCPGCKDPGAYVGGGSVTPECPSRSCKYFTPRRKQEVAEERVQKVYNSTDCPQGVSLGVEGDSYVMKGSTGKHTLNIDDTPEDRLRTHFEGFCENQPKAAKTVRALRKCALKEDWERTQCGLCSTDLPEPGSYCESCAPTYMQFQQEMLQDLLADEQWAGSFKGWVDPADYDAFVEFANSDSPTLEQAQHVMEDIYRSFVERRTGYLADVQDEREAGERKLKGMEEDRQERLRKMNRQKRADSGQVVPGAVPGHSFSEPTENDIKRRGQEPEEKGAVRKTALDTEQMLRLNETDGNVEYDEHGVLQEGETWPTGKLVMDPSQTTVPGGNVTVQTEDGRTVQLTEDKIRVPTVTAKFIRRFGAKTAGKMQDIDDVIKSSAENFRNEKFEESVKDLKRALQMIQEAFPDRFSQEREYLEEKVAPMESRLHMKGMWDEGMKKRAAAPGGFDALGRLLRSWHWKSGTPQVDADLSSAKITCSPEDDFDLMMLLQANKWNPVRFGQGKFSVELSETGYARASKKTAAEDEKDDEKDEVEGEVRDEGDGEETSEDDDASEEETEATEETEEEWDDIDDEEFFAEDDELVDDALLSDEGVDDVQDDWSMGLVDPAPAPHHLDMAPAVLPEPEPLPDPHEVLQDLEERIREHNVEGDELRTLVDDTAQETAELIDEFLGTKEGGVIQEKELARQKERERIKKQLEDRRRREGEGDEGSRSRGSADKDCKACGHKMKNREGKMCPMCGGTEFKQRTIAKKASRSSIVVAEIL